MLTELPFPFTHIHNNQGRLSKMRCYDSAAHLAAPCFQFDTCPDGFALIEDDIEFDPAVHLQLEMPEQIKSLTELGYSDEELTKLQMPSDVAVTSLYRVLSDEGLAAMRHVMKQLEAHAVVSPRIPCVLRGSPKVAPEKPVDRWHFDTTPLVMVLFLTDPDEYEGGHFEYFDGTIYEAQRLIKETGSLPEDRIRRLGRQKAGYGVFQQGPAVMHRASAVTSGPERITFVQSYVSTDPLAFGGCNHLAESYNGKCEDASLQISHAQPSACLTPRHPWYRDFRLNLTGVDPLNVFMPDWVRFRSWVASLELSKLLHPSLLYTLSGALAERDSDVVGPGKRVLTLLDKMQAAIACPFIDAREDIVATIDKSLPDLQALAAQLDETSEHFKSVRRAADMLASAREDVLTLDKSTMAYF
ncbi:uncharacterized protein MONBRDRAFT_30851 [Monosiga brevicollis MX1]|uniref:Fe2OG dioxygenase domain-containing protein n=1 Tax=Monosiga brevicollis TaxID=81824 RepID=A9UPQ9_MONBE|nr:uncharacterized protein MONBRDRAFT_30851 [Monosiga brevicollis MX1]EDQ92913.1 predicted protein [Monosiga brevicollis MX1]|eukprot:XP_001742675.1 hypothetical protein [Monosiga brevicollis MX1]